MRMITTSMAAAIAMAQLSALTVTREDERQVSVRADDLDLSRDSDVARFRTRIGVAVGQVCPVEGRIDVSANARRLACRAVAMASARPQMDRAVAAARQGSPALAAR